MTSSPPPMLLLIFCGHLDRTPPWLKKDHLSALVTEEDKVQIPTHNSLTTSKTACTSSTWCENRA
jgi:hypothetical protein